MKSYLNRKKMRRIAVFMLACLYSPIKTFSLAIFLVERDSTIAGYLNYKSLKRKPANFSCKMNFWHDSCNR